MKKLWLCSGTQSNSCYEILSTGLLRILQPCSLSLKLKGPSNYVLLSFLHIVPNYFAQYFIIDLQDRISSARGKNPILFGSYQYLIVVVCRTLVHFPFLLCVFFLSIRFISFIFISFSNYQDFLGKSFTFQFILNEPSRYQSHKKYNVFVCLISRFPRS